MWTTDQCNAQRNGQSGAPAMLQLQTDIDFGASATTSGVYINQAPVFGPNNTMLYAAANGSIECRDVSSRTLLWTHAGPSSPTTLTLAPDGSVYYGHSGGLSALSSTGTLRWTFSSYGACVIAPVIGASGKVYACFAHAPSGFAAVLVGLSSSGVVTSFLLYTNALTNGCAMSIANLNGVEVVLYPTTSGQIMPFSSSSGSAVWSNVHAQLGGPQHGSMAVGADGTIYALASVSGVGQLSACNASGSILWTYELNQSVSASSTPALSADGTAVYVIGTDLHAVSAADGSALWTTSGASFVGSPVVSSEGYVGGLNLKSYCLEFRDPWGKVCGRPYNGMSMATGPMSVSSDGSVFVAQTNGRVRIARNSQAANPLPVPPPPPPPAPVPPPPAPVPPPPAPPAPAPAPVPPAPPAPPSAPVTSGLCYGQSFPAGVQLAHPQQLGSLVATSFSPTGLAVDPLTQDVYWTDGPAVFKCPASGGVPQTVISGLGFNPASLALDLPNLRIFCCDAGGGAVCRLNLSTGTTTRLVTGLSLPVAVAVDVAGNRLFWVEYNPGSVQTSDLTGQSVTRLLAGLALPQSLAIDPARQRLYWAAKTEIAASGYDGLGLSTVTTLAPAQPNSNSRKLALDASAQKLYWTDQASQSLQRADLASGAITTILSKAQNPGFSNPTVIALVTG